VWRLNLQFTYVSSGVPSLRNSPMTKFGEILLERKVRVCNSCHRRNVI